MTIKDDVERIAKPIFEKAAQEGSLNHTLVGKSFSTSKYNPHNHRLYFTYQKPKFSLVEGMVKGWFIFLHSKNYNSELVFEDTRTLSKIIIKKTQAEVRFKSRNWFLVSNLNPEEVDEIVKQRRSEAIALFKEFVVEWGGTSDFNLLKEKVLDNTIKDNSLVDQIPIKAYWEDEVSKKLYEENKIEMKSEIYAKNLIHNAGLNDFSPQIATYLKEIHTEILNQRSGVVSANSKDYSERFDTSYPSEEITLTPETLILKLNSVEDLEKYKDEIIPFLTSNYMFEDFDGSSLLIEKMKSIFDKEDKRC